MAENNNDWAIPFIVGLIILIIFLIFGAVAWNSADDHQTVANFGDMFGVLTSLFTGLTLAGIVYTGYLQRKDLLTQINMLQQQVEENRESRKALEDQAKHLYDSSRISAIASKMDFFSDAKTGAVCKELYGDNAEFLSQNLILELDELLGTTNTKYKTLRFRCNGIFTITNCTIDHPIQIRTLHNRSTYSFTISINYETGADLIQTVIENQPPLPNPFVSKDVTNFNQVMTIHPKSKNIIVKVTGVKNQWDKVSLSAYCIELEP